MQGIADTAHSIYSSCFYLDVMLSMLSEIPEISRKLEINFLKLIVVNSYIISKHHGSLDEWAQFPERLEQSMQIIENNPQMFGEYRSWRLCASDILHYACCGYDEISKDRDSESLYYIYSNFLFSLLVASDFYATTEYMSNKRVEDLGIIKESKFYREQFEQTEILQSIRKYEKLLISGESYLFFEQNDINKLRTAMFLDTEQELLLNTDEHIFYLEAPTGAGKTNMSFNLALHLVETQQQNKIFYIFPFNALVEQTKVGLRQIFSTMNEVELEKHIGVINSLTPFTNRNEENTEQVENDYLELLQQRQFLHYPIVLTTHVNFFNYLFGTGREAHFPLNQIANSVVILDEIQSYKNEIWTEIIYFLKQYAELLNIKVLIMSATLPNLAQLLELEHEPVRINKNANKYFKHPLFKNRVKFSDEFIAKTVGKKFDDVTPLIKNLVGTLVESGKRKILIEFMRKKNAVMFYQQLKTILPEYDVELITGDDNLIERQRIINKTQTTRNLILIATQVIEAGVDIDMEVGIKQVSLFDSEEQFAGRINRSSKNKTGGIVYFFTIDEVSVYKTDLRANERFTVLNSDVFEQLKEKRIQEFYAPLLNEIKEQRELHNDNYNFKKFKEKYVNGLNYRGIEKQMQLITPREEFIFVLAQECNRDLIALLWNELATLLENNNLDYAQWRIRVHDKYSELQKYSYRMQKYGASEDITISYDGKIGDMYLILNGEQYFEYGKFIRTELEENLRSSYEMI